MVMQTIPKKRCAIYTRKSVEEGLDQEFNSLDAQREAGEAYIASQKANGWVCLPTRYDDGGYSGGNMKRSALQQLLTDCEAGLVDIIVVYKIDRLSRSICDFADLSKKFDEWGTQFVAVTQEINTATSAGRMISTFSSPSRNMSGRSSPSGFATRWRPAGRKANGSAAVFQWATAWKTKSWLLSRKKHGSFKESFSSLLRFSLPN